VPAGVRRIAREEAESAIDYLGGKSGTNRDEAIHEARKCVKKLRALLRLTQPQPVGSAAAAASHLRSIGQKLSGPRDAGALTTTFDDLCSQKKKLKDRSLQKVRRNLEQRKQHLEQEANLGELMHKLEAPMEEVRKSIKHWPLANDGFAAIRDGFEAT